MLPECAGTRGAGWRRRTRGTYYKRAQVQAQVRCAGKAATPPRAHAYSDLSSLLRGHLRGEGRGELGEEGLGAAVDGGEGRGHAAGGGGREADEARAAGVEEAVEEVVRDAHGAGGVALKVGHKGGERDVGEHARRDIAGVVEDDADEDVARGRGDGLHVAVFGQIRPNASDLHLRKPAVYKLDCRNGR